jgi:hypothetical protein
MIRKYYKTIATPSGDIEIIHNEKTVGRIMQTPANYVISLDYVVGHTYKDKDDFKSLDELFGYLAKKWKRQMNHKKKIVDCQVIIDLTGASEIAKRGVQKETI